MEIAALPTDRSHQLEEILHSDHLPSPSGVALRILELTRDPDASIEDLQRTLTSDPALAGRVLQYANCAQVCGAREVRTVSEAVVRLGMRTVRQLALGFSVLAQARSGPCEGFDYNGFWSRSLAQAVGGQALAPHCKGATAEEAFTCGLLGGIGMLSLASVHPQKYGEVLGRWNGHDRDQLAALEQEVLLVSHDQVTAALFERWGLPADYAAAIVAPGDDATRLPLARVLTAAAAMADLCMAPDEGRGPLLLALLDRAAALGVAREQALEASEAALADWKRLGDVLDIITEDLPSLATLAARAVRPAAAPADDLRELASDVLGTFAMPEAPDAPDADRDGPLRVLVVGSAPSERQALAARLASTGHQVEAAADGEEALARTLRWAPHVIVSDRAMAPMDGLQLCRSLRSADQASGVYIIVVNGDGRTEDLVAALDAGADDYIPAPVDPEALTARLRAAERLVRIQDRAAHDREAIRAFAAELGVANRKLQHLALHDLQTGLPNRRYAIDRLEKEWGRARRHGTPLVCMILDLDHFRSINEAYGLAAGDVVLQHTARAIQACLRTTDDVCRFGGDELIAICPGADTGLAQMLADRLRRAVEANQIEAPEFTGRVTVSIGVAGASPEVATATELIRLADEGLIAAKDAGFNKVCVVDHGPGEPA